MRFTVITASYNSQNFLRNTVESVYNQKYKCYEHIIIDDKSTDNSLRIAKNLEDEFCNVRVIEHEFNKGYPSALNSGIAASNTEYIAILDSDDIALPYWLEEVSKFIKSYPDAGIVGGGCILMTEKGEVTNQIKYVEKKGDVSSDILEGKYMVLHPGSVIKKDVLSHFGGYSTELKSLEDSDMFINMASKSSVYNLGIPLINYRRLRKSESRKSSDFTTLANLYISEKIKLIKRGYSFTDIQLKLNPIVLKLNSVKRLEGLSPGEYEFEISRAFFSGKKYLKAYQYFIISMRSLFPLKKIYCRFFL